MTRCQHLVARCVSARVAPGGGALSIVLSTASILCVAGGAHGAITSVSGQATQLGSPPVSCGPGTLTGFTAFAWDEQQNTLQNLFVNETQNPGGSATPVPGFVSGVYDSHFIHYEGIPGVVNAVGTVTFAQPIVAVIFRALDLDNSDAPAGAFGTAYPTSYPFRTIATNPPSTFTVLGNTLSFNLSSFQPTGAVVQLRVLTNPVPAPGAACALTAMGAAGLLRRRRR